LLLLLLLGSLCMHLPFLLLLLLLPPLLLLLLFLLQQVSVLFPATRLLPLWLLPVCWHWVFEALWWFGLTLGVGRSDVLEGVGLSLPVDGTAHHSTPQDGRAWHC
jgi:hypothetical protein